MTPQAAELFKQYQKETAACIGQPVSFYDRNSALRTGYFVKLSLTRTEVLFHVNTSYGTYKVKFNQIKEV